jgi:hypothetical protein
LVEVTKIDDIICSLAIFYKGAASFEWLENQTLSKIMSLQEQANKINKELSKE